MDVSREEFIKKIQAIVDARREAEAEADADAATTADKVDAEYRAYAAIRQTKYLRYKKTGHYR